MNSVDLAIIAAGLLLLAVGIACGWVAARGENRMLAIQDTPTSNTRDIQVFHASGALGQRCELSGVLECDAPLHGPLSGQPCAAYSHMLRWEEWGPAPAYSRRPGEMVCRNSGTEFDDRRVPAFWVRDATGRVLVDPANAELDMTETDHRYEVFTASFGGTERRNWREEKALPIGRPVYVLGYLADQQGQPAIGRHPRDAAKKFLISYRSEHELVRTNRWQSYIYYLAAGTSGTLGVLMVVWRLVLPHVR
jgi:hypothetical protein